MFFSAANEAFQRAASTASSTAAAPTRRARSHRHPKPQNASDPTRESSSCASVSSASLVSSAVLLSSSPLEVHHDTSAAQEGEREGSPTLEYGPPFDESQEGRATVTTCPRHPPSSTRLPTTSPSRMAGHDASPSPSSESLLTTDVGEEKEESGKRRDSPAEKKTSGRHDTRGGSPPPPSTSSTTTPFPLPPSAESFLSSPMPLAAMNLPLPSSSPTLSTLLLQVHTCFTELPAGWPSDHRRRATLSGGIHGTHSEKTRSSPSWVPLEESVHQLLHTCREGLLAMRRHVQQQVHHLHALQKAMEAERGAASPFPSAASFSLGPQTPHAMTWWTRHFPFLRSRLRYTQEYDWYLLAQHLRLPVECFVVEGGQWGRASTTNGHHPHIPREQEKKRRSSSSTVSSSSTMSVSDSEQTSSFPCWWASQQPTTLEWRYVEEVDRMTLLDQLHLARVTHHSGCGGGGGGGPTPTPSAVYFTDGHVYTLWRELWAVVLAIWRQRAWLYPPALQPTAEDRRQEAWAIATPGEEAAPHPPLSGGCPAWMVYPWHPTRAPTPRQEEEDEEAALKEGDALWKWSGVPLTASAAWASLAWDGPLSTSSLSPVSLHPRHERHTVAGPGEEAREDGGGQAGGSLARLRVVPWRVGHRSATRSGAGEGEGEGVHVPASRLLSSFLGVGGRGKEESAPHPKRREEDENDFPLAAPAVGPFTPAAIGVDLSDNGEVYRVYRRLHHAYETAQRTRRRQGSMRGRGGEGGSSRIAPVVPQPSLVDPKGCPRTTHHRSGSSPHPSSLARCTSSCSSYRMVQKYGTPMLVPHDGLSHTTEPETHDHSIASALLAPPIVEEEDATRRRTTSCRVLEDEEEEEEEEEEDFATSSSLFSSTARRVLLQRSPIGSVGHYTLLHFLHPLVWRRLRLWSAEGEPQASRRSDEKRTPHHNIPMAAGDHAPPLQTEKKKKNSPAREKEEEEEEEEDPFAPAAAPHSVPLFLDSPPRRTPRGALLSSSSCAEDGCVLEATLAHLQHEQASIEKELARVVPYLTPEHYHTVRLLLTEVRQRCRATTPTAMAVREGRERKDGGGEMPSCGGGAPHGTRRETARHHPHHERASIGQGPHNKDETKTKKNGDDGHAACEQRRRLLLHACEGRLQRIRECLTHSMHESGWNVAVLALGMALSAFDLRSESHLSPDCVPVIDGGEEEAKAERRTSLYPTTTTTSSSCSLSLGFPPRTAQVWQDIQEWVRRETMDANANLSTSSSFAEGKHRPVEDPSKKEVASSFSVVPRRPAAAGQTFVYATLYAFTQELLPALMSAIFVEMHALARHSSAHPNDRPASALFFPPISSSSSSSSSSRWLRAWLWQCIQENATKSPPPCHTKATNGIYDTPRPRPSPYQFAAEWVWHLHQVYPPLPWRCPSSSSASAASTDSGSAFFHRTPLAYVFAPGVAHFLWESCGGAHTTRFLPSPSSSSASPPFSLAPTGAFTWDPVQRQRAFLQMAASACVDPPLSSPTTIALPSFWMRALERHHLLSSLRFPLLRGTVTAAVSLSRPPLLSFPESLSSPSFSSSSLWWCSSSSMRMVEVWDRFCHAFTLFCRWHGSTSTSTAAAAMCVEKPFHAWGSEVKGGHHDDDDDKATSLWTLSSNGRLVLSPTRPRRVHHLWKMWWLQFLFLADGTVVSSSSSLEEEEERRRRGTPVHSEGGNDASSSSPDPLVPVLRLDRRRALLSGVAQRWRAACPPLPFSTSHVEQAVTPARSSPLLPQERTRRGWRSVLFALSDEEPFLSSPTPFFVSLDVWDALLHAWWVTQGRSLSSSSSSSGSAASSTPLALPTPSSFRLRGALYPLLGRGEGVAWGQRVWSPLSLPHAPLLLDFHRYDKSSTTPPPPSLLPCTPTTTTIATVPWRASRPLLVEAVRRVLWIDRPFGLPLPHLARSFSFLGGVDPSDTETKVEKKEKNGTPLERTPPLPHLHPARPSEAVFPPPPPPPPPPAVEVCHYIVALRQLVVCLQQWEGDDPPALTSICPKGEKGGVPSSPLQRGGGGAGGDARQGAAWIDSDKGRRSEKEREPLGQEASRVPRWTQFFPSALTDPLRSTTPITREEERRHRAIQKVHLLRAFLLYYPLDTASITRIEHENAIISLSENTEHPTQKIEGGEHRRRKGPSDVAPLRPLLPASLRVAVWEILLGLPSRAAQASTFAAVCEANAKRFRSFASSTSFSNPNGEKKEENKKKRHTEDKGGDTPPRSVSPPPSSSSLLRQQEKQLFMDLPRCQAGDPLFALNGIVQQTMRLVLQCCTVGHDGASSSSTSTMSCGYFQGLDTLCAVLLRLVTPSRPALLYAFLQRIVQDYVAYDTPHPLPEEEKEEEGPKKKELARMRGGAGPPPSASTRASLSDQMGRFAAVLSYVDPELFHHIMPPSSPLTPPHKARDDQEEEEEEEENASPGLSSSAPSPPAREGVSPVYFSVPWLLTLFSHLLPYRQVLRVWDVLFLYAPLQWEPFSSSSSSCCSSLSPVTSTAIRKAVLQEGIAAYGLKPFLSSSKAPSSSQSLPHWGETSPHHTSTTEKKEKEKRIRPPHSTHRNEGENDRQRFPLRRCVGSAFMEMEEAEEEEEADEVEAEMQEVWQALSRHSNRQGQPYPPYRRAPEAAPEEEKKYMYMHSPPSGGRLPIFSHALICLCVALVRQRRALLLQQQEFDALLHTLSHLTLPVERHQEAEEEETNENEEDEAGGSPRPPSEEKNSSGVSTTTSLPPLSSRSTVLDVECWLKDAVALMHEVPPSVGLQPYGTHHTALFLLRQDERTTTEKERKKREKEDSWRRLGHAASSSLGRKASTSVCASVARYLAASAARPREWRMAVPLLWKSSPSFFPRLPSPSLLPLLPSSLRFPLSSSSSLYPSRVIPFMSAADVYWYWQQWMSTRLQPHPSASSSSGESFPGLLLIDARTCLPLPPPLHVASSSFSSSSSASSSRSVSSRGVSDVPLAKGETNRKKHPKRTPTTSAAVEKKEEKKRKSLTRHHSHSSSSPTSTSSSSSRMSGASPLPPSSPLASIPREKLLLMEDDDDTVSSSSSSRQGKLPRRGRKKKKKERKDSPQPQRRGRKASPVVTAPSSPFVSSAAAMEEEEETLGISRASSSSSSSSFSSSTARRASTTARRHRTPLHQVPCGGVCRAYDHHLLQRTPVPRRTSSSSSSFPLADVPIDRDGHAHTAHPKDVLHAPLSPCTCARCGALAASVHLSFLATTDFSCVDDACVEVLALVRTAPHLFFIPPYAVSSSRWSGASTATLAESPPLPPRFSRDVGALEKQRREAIEPNEKEAPVRRIPKASNESTETGGSRPSSSLPPWPHMVFVLSPLPLSLFSLSVSSSSEEEEKEEKQKKKAETSSTHHHAGDARQRHCTQDVHDTEHRPPPRSNGKDERERRRKAARHPLGSNTVEEEESPPSVLRSLLAHEVRQWKREEAMVAAVIHRLQTQYQVPRVSILAGGAAALRECHPAWFLPSRSRQRGPTIRR